MGYNENQYSLPRIEDLSISRQSVYDDTYLHIPTVGWMFVPLVVYHSGQSTPSAGCSCHVSSTAQVSLHRYANCVTVLHFTVDMLQVARPLCSSRFPSTCGSTSGRWLSIWAPVLLLATAATGNSVTLLLLVAVTVAVSVTGFESGCCVKDSLPL